ncbi:MAG: choice-of-anchor tandem repeat GloVer-containing protein [Bryobacteraceae bacterium]|jgi:uncharacterized repeat protein (TIGR03803 family)
MKQMVNVLLLCAAATATLPAQTFTTLVKFNEADGATPFYGALVQGLDGNLYGTTQWGGTDTTCTAFRVTGCGTVFKMTPAGKLTTLHSFVVTDGANPYGGLVLATDGNFYGTTYAGGANGLGTVFRMTPAGTLTTLYSFAGTDGSYPVASLLQAANGNLYGTTIQGGTEGAGTIFEITLEGALTTLHSFCSDGPSCLTDGVAPYGALIQATNGNFYGTTEAGGEHGAGTVFSMAPGGATTILASFDVTDGESPYAGLIQASNGKFYGTTTTGAANSVGNVFEIAAGGTLTNLHSFGGQGGLTPYAGVVQGTDGNLYGATFGLVYEMTIGGHETVIEGLNSDNGRDVYAAMVQGTDGIFYGTTAYGGANHGTIYSVSAGLGAFVKTLPVSAKAGTSVTILGTDLTGATSVSFNGAAAAFRVVSATEISTAVPTGASTGKVQVVTPGGTLSSNVPFQVQP